MSRMVGVDIGATHVRVAEVAGVDASGFALVTRAGMAPVEPGAVVAGRIRDPRAVSVALVRAIREAGVPRYGFVVSVSSPDVAISRMLLPAAVRRDERVGAVRALNRPLSPTFGLDESVLATQLVDVDMSPDGTQMATIAVAAAHDADIEALEAVCKLARSQPRAFDLSAAALLRALSRANPQSGEIATVVDIGASKVTVATRSGHHLRSVRTTAGAGIELTRAIAQATGESVDDAERRKLTMRLPQLSSASASVVGGYDVDETTLDDFDAPERALSQSVDLMIDSIAQSIELDATNYGTYTQAVTICGGTALLRGLKDRLQRRVGVPVVIGRPWAEIERSRRNAAYFRDGNVDPRALMSLSTAVGLALWKDPL